MNNNEQIPNVHTQLQRNAEAYNMGDLLRESAAVAMIGAVAFVGGRELIGNGIDTVKAASPAIATGEHVVVTTPGKPDVNQPRPPEAALGGAAVSGDVTSISIYDSPAKTRQYLGFVYKDLKDVLGDFRYGGITIEPIAYVPETKPQVKRNSLNPDHQVATLPEGVTEAFTTRVTGMVGRAKLNKRTTVGVEPKVTERSIMENPNFKVEVELLAASLSEETGKNIKPSAVFASWRAGVLSPNISGYLDEVYAENSFGFDLTVRGSTGSQAGDKINL